MKIVILCAGGMSSSMLREKMRIAAKANGSDDEIISCSEVEMRKNRAGADIILLSPQVRYLKKDFERQGGAIVEVIDMLSYGRMDGDAVYRDAIKLLNHPPALKETN